MGLVDRGVVWFVTAAASSVASVVGRRSLAWSSASPTQ